MRRYVAQLARISWRRKTMRGRTLWILSAMLAAACYGNGGAVTVKWQITDLATGHQLNPTDSSSTGAATRDGSGQCCASHPFGSCDANNTWIVTKLGVSLTDPTTGVPAGNVTPPDCAIQRQAAVEFECTKGEGTTQFIIEPGTYAVDLEACVTDSQGAPAHVAVPPSQVHSVARGDIVALPVVEIGVNQ